MTLASILRVLALLEVGGESVRESSGVPAFRCSPVAQTLIKSNRYLCRHVLRHHAGKKVEEERYSLSDHNSRDENIGHGKDQGRYLFADSYLILFATIVQPLDNFFGPCCPEIRALYCAKVRLKLALRWVNALTLLLIIAVFFETPEGNVAIISIHGYFECLLKSLDPIIETFLV